MYSHDLTDHDESKYLTKKIPICIHQIKIRAFKILKSISFTSNTNDYAVEVSTGKYVYYEHIMLRDREII